MVNDSPAYTASLNLYPTDDGQPWVYVARWVCGDIDESKVTEDRLVALQWLGERALAGDTPSKDVRQ